MNSQKWLWIFIHYLSQVFFPLSLCQVVKRLYDYVYYSHISNHITAIFQTKISDELWIKLNTCKIRLYIQSLPGLLNQEISLHLFWFLQQFTLHKNLVSCTKAKAIITDRYSWLKKDLAKVFIYVIPSWQK